MKEPQKDEPVLEALDSLNVKTEGGQEYTKRGWTLGNSVEVVDGAPKESPLVSFAWIAVPTVITLLLLAALFA